SQYYQVRRSERAAATYALDLSGAAAACVAGVVLLVGVGVDGALLVLAGLSGGAAILASMRADTALRGKGLPLAALCALLAAGAGLEVRIARAAAVPEVEAVELNAAIIRLVRRWQPFGGPIYDLPGVTLFVEEGRTFVLTRRRRYDLIQMSLVLTSSAQTGTYALAEGYLYTEEAFRSYLDHLEPAGLLAMIDDSFERTLKNAVTAVTVFERTLGLRSDEAMKRMAVMFNPRQWEPGYRYLLLVSPAPLSDERIRRLTEEVARRPLDSLWLPGGAADPRFRALATSGARAFARAAPMNLEPPTAA